MLLAKPTAEGITNISGEPGGPTEQDVHGAAENKMKDQIQDGCTVCLQLQVERYCGCKPLFAINGSGDKAAPEEGEVPTGVGSGWAGSGDALGKLKSNLAKVITSVQ